MDDEQNARQSDEDNGPSDIPEESPSTESELALSSQVERRESDDDEDDG